jgi:hypothetical protein
MFSFLRRRQTARATPARQHDFRPRLELLEDRALPDAGLLPALADPTILAPAPADQQTAALVAQEKSAIAGFAGKWVGSTVEPKGGKVTAVSLTITPMHNRLAFAKFESTDGPIADGAVAFDAADKFAGSLRSTAEQIEIQGNLVHYADGNQAMSARLQHHSPGDGIPTMETLFAFQTTTDFYGPFVGGLPYAGSSQSNLPGSDSVPMTAALVQGLASNSISGSIALAVKGTRTELTILAAVVNTAGMIDLIAQTTDGSNLTLNVTASFTSSSTFPPPISTVGPPPTRLVTEISGTYSVSDGGPIAIDSGTFTVSQSEIVFHF